MTKSLHEAKVCYLPLEKVFLAVVHTPWKFPHYFQSHIVVILTQLLLRSLLRSADYTGKIAKWGTILGAFDIKYIPHTSVKGQVLVDLVAEFAKTRPTEKAFLAVVHAMWKLPHYFQSHTVVVLTQLLLRSLLRSANYIGKIAKWGTILGALDIKYMPRTSVKGQVLADLMAKFAKTPFEEKVEKQNMDVKSIGMVSL